MSDFEQQRFKFSSCTDSLAPSCQPDLRKWDLTYELLPQIPFCKTRPSHPYDT